ncbi:TetR/AcrR family transcriptional regulator [Pseudonocardia alaniniphila]|uniref:TetR/AcrR family transcriptional regulator n=1 Tax=Pseudonocardia alaniniphila TaxID=75291 RepID=A0ABS9TGW8_9PSEU|nr:TetR/AcrR family transcriptional regulator [Pseudonocardia alaniniphila]MCH6167526.1 TetR/AcrR family transcriptional regulator [Pseudonocardia alaniniphila]
MRARVEGLRSNGAEPHDSKPATSSRGLILDATEKLMGEKGYAATPISAICKESGLPVGSVYHHFDNKAGILVEVVNRGTRRHFAALADAANDESEPDLHMWRYYEETPKMLIANVDIILILFATLQQSPDSSVAAHAHAAVELAASMLRTVIEPVATLRGVSDPAATALRLAHASITYTWGAVLTAGRDLERLTTQMAPLYDLVRGAIQVEAIEAGVAADNPQLRR